jgi:hypothetical protein
MASPEAIRRCSDVVADLANKLELAAKHRRPNRELWVLAEQIDVLAVRLDPSDGCRSLISNVDYHCSRWARGWTSELLFVTKKMNPGDAEHWCSEGIRFILREGGRHFDPAMTFLLSGLPAERAHAIALGAAHLIVDEYYPSQMISNGTLAHGGPEVDLDAALSSDVALCPTFYRGPVEHHQAEQISQPTPDKLKACRLTTQELVDLLKMPTCVSQVRRVVLDHLGDRYNRRFFNHWAFVRYAREQHLDLDLTSPPTRPDPKESLKRMLETLNKPASSQ